MSNNASPTPPSGGGGNDGQIIGHLIAAFAGVFLTVLVDFGVPLSDAQQRDLLSLVVTGWALFAGAYAWLTRARHPVIRPPAVTGQAPAPTLTDETAQLRAVPPGGVPVPLDTTGYTGTVSPAPGGQGRVAGTAPVWPPTSTPQSWPPYNAGYGGSTVDDGRRGGDQTGPPQAPHDGRYERG